MITLSETNDSFTNTAVFGTIDSMPELDEMITVADAILLAEGAGREYTRSHITHVLRSGDIPGAVKMGKGKTNIWLVPKNSFLTWLKEDRKPGPKPED